MAAVAHASGPSATVRQNLPFIIAASSGHADRVVRFLSLWRARRGFRDAFFPARKPVFLAYSEAWAVFWFGFILRPFGAILFGHLGDLIGRKFTFMLTLIIMGVATFLVGCIPSYETGGVLAPVLIVADARDPRSGIGW